MFTVNQLTEKLTGVIEIIENAFAKHCSFHFIHNNFETMYYHTVKAFV